MAELNNEEELASYSDYEEEVDQEEVKNVPSNGVKKGHYAGIHSASFKEFLLKPELLRAITDCGFEHPSEVQQECIPQAILGQDVLCQAKSGMGKTAVFVHTILHKLEHESPIPISCIVLAHTRELAYQIQKEFERFSRYLPTLKVALITGGDSAQEQEDLLKNNPPHIICGCPGRVLKLARDKKLKFDNLKFFILDECDKMLEALDMRGDVQSIFRMTPHDKQVMMFSATMSKDIRPICRKFMRNKLENSDV